MPHNVHIFSSCNRWQSITQNYISHDRHPSHNISHIIAKKVTAINIRRPWGC